MKTIRNLTFALALLGLPLASCQSSQEPQSPPAAQDSPVESPGAERESALESQIDTLESGSVINK